MAGVGGQDLTLLDIAKAGGDSMRVTVVDQLSQMEDMISDGPTVECNKKDAHESEVLTGLPKSFYAKFNKGTVPSKGTTSIISDGTAMLEARSRVDARILDRIKRSDGPDAAAARMFQGARFYHESLAQQVAEAIIYGNVRKNPEQIAGLATRYSDPEAANARNILSYETGSTAANEIAKEQYTSIWLIGWSSQTCHFIYPSGMAGGFTQEAIPKQTLQDADGGEYEVYREKFGMTTGLALPDWRFAVRLANIKVSDFESSSKREAANNLITGMIQMCERLESTVGVKACFYMNRKIRQYLRLLTKREVYGGGGLTYDNVEGKRVLAFDDFPVRISDSIINTEVGLTHKDAAGASSNNKIDPIAAALSPITFTKTAS